MNWEKGEEAGTRDEILEQLSGERRGERRRREVERYWDLGGGKGKLKPSIHNIGESWKRIELIPIWSLNWSYFLNSGSQNTKLSI